MNSFDLLPTEDNLMKAFEEDLLLRNKEIVYFYDLLRAQETASAIAIDGRWGSGKTFFVKQTMLLINAKNPKSEMDEDQKERILSHLSLGTNDDEIADNYDMAIYYDAWKNDNDTDPVLSIIYEIAKQLALTYLFQTDANMFALAGSIIEAISGRNINGIIESLKCENPLSKFREQKEAPEKLKIFLTEILAERGNRLIVFIDELDRCKPSYAVQLLEQIKHYLCDERITFVFSVNLNELQHTIKHYYGDLFDACRYLDRFFDIRIAMPPADLGKLYEKLGLNSRYVLESVCKRVIDNYHFELREITHYYRQVRTAVYEPTHDGKKWDFSFFDGNGKRLVLLYIVPIIIGLECTDLTLCDEFISGRNSQPLIDILGFEEVGEMVLNDLLNKDESFEEDQKKKLVTEEEKIKQLYEAIFANNYSGGRYCTRIGAYEFNKDSKMLAITTAGLLSKYVDYSI